jgi:CheY-like chemotaxis protein/signal transduction histidine kinase
MNRHGTNTASLQADARVLVVDDEQYMCDVCSRTLQRAGYDVVATTNPHEAARALSSDPPFDLLLTDIKMPMMSGFDLIQIARESDPFIAIIIITDFGSMENLQQSIQAGVADFLSKPFELEQLRLAVDQCLSTRYLRQLDFVSAALFDDLHLSDQDHVSQQPQQPGRILVVDDESYMCDICSRTLRRTGYNVVAASSPLQIVRALRSDPPFDLLLTDIKMPVMNGLDLVHIVRENNPSIAAIIMTGYASMENLQQSVQAGVADFLSKPFELEQLRLAVDQSFAKQRIRKIDPTIIKNLGYLIQDAAKEATISLLVVSIENLQVTEAMKFLNSVEAKNVQSDIHKLSKDKVVIVPHAKHIARIGNNDIIAFVPTPLINETIEQMVEHFYMHPLIQAQNTTLTFGWSHGPFPSPIKLIEAVAHDLTERRLSQGLSSGREPLILSLYLENTSIQKQYKFTKKIRNLYQNYLKIGLGGNESTIRWEIGNLIAVIDHDLNSGSSGLLQTIKDLITKNYNISNQAKETLDWMWQRLILCSTWQRSMAELGTPKILQPRVINVESWLIEHMFLLCKHLELNLEIEIFSISKTLKMYLDTQILLVSCLHLLLSAYYAKSRKIRISASKKQNRFILLFEDDGEISQRMLYFQNDLSFKQNNSFSWQYRHLLLLHYTLRLQDITIYCQNKEKYFQIHWDIQEYNSDLEVINIDQDNLEQELTRMEYDIEQIESQLNAPVKITNQPVKEQVIQLLLPHVQELEKNLLSIVNKSTILMTSTEIDAASSNRIHNFSLYCYLLIRNLMLALQKKKLPSETISVNEQVYQVLDLLEHRMSSLEVSLNLESSLPMLSIASVEFKQILMNLIKNSFEASEGDGILYIKTSYKEDSILIQIRDTGAGISFENRKKIFQLSFSTKGKGTNSGVGLYAVQSIVRRAGGRIRVASATKNEKGKLVTWQSGFGIRNPFHWTSPGTLFQIELPIAKEGIADVESAEHPGH